MKTNIFLTKKELIYLVEKEYERYIGTCYDKKGYNVKFHGIEKGFEDLDIDLICIKSDETLLIQYKKLGTKQEHSRKCNLSII